MLREAYRVNTAAVFEIMAMFDRRQDEAMPSPVASSTGWSICARRWPQGRGAILLAAHMGNAALVPLRLASAGWPVSVLYKESRMMSADFFLEGLARYGIQGIAANAGLRLWPDARGAEAGADRVPDARPGREAGEGRAGAALPRQGHADAGWPGAARRAARAPVLPVATLAATPWWRFALQPPLALGQDTLEADVATWSRATERVVLDQPQLWSWQQRRWRSVSSRGGVGAGRALRTAPSVARRLPARAFRA